MIQSLVQWNSKFLKDLIGVEIHVEKYNDDVVLTQLKFVVEILV